MKPEPLTKEKIMKEIIIRQSLNESYKYEFLNFYVYLEHVKSAVDLVLEEIEKKKEKEKKVKERLLPGSSKVYTEGIIEGLTIAEQIIKKAFSGVVEK